MTKNDARLEVGVVPSAGLLLLRVGVGMTMAIAHGWPKLERFMGPEPRFADPFGLGEVPSLALAIFGELVCGVLIALGLGTRLAAIPFAFTMLVAVFVAHAADPWSDKEHAFLFLVPAIALMITGPGRYSIDAWIAARRRR
ncbi:DoxX family protein [Sandaracinus amylolyticus]|uniref:DoxX family protein n=1 Tax=Sandaracinus amylolyticus TaxID=927083 RepID=UPI001F22B0FA|nr:DoxX family protein [Sandaracinus amylolyticus]UJR81099.1 Transmembrane DoxX protein [Sandaracinus amylolyticus]